MELYTLDETFLKEYVIDEYMSAIWVERFAKAGDTQIILPVTPERITRLAEGKFLAEQSSDEIMIIESQSIENGLITVKGRTPEAFFNERYIRNSSDPAVSEWLINDRPGNILAKLVHDVAITGVATVGIGDADNAIPFLVNGTIDQSDAVISKKIPFGPMYDAMLPIAETYKLGMKVYLSRADPFGYELTFTVYKGIDRTSAQLANDLVRFSSAQDSMTNVKQVSSVVGYKTVVYVFPPSWSSATPPVVIYAPGSSAAARGFARRVLVLQASEISADQVTGTATLASLMQQAGKDALANNNYTKIVDGEVVPQPQYKYGTNYKLGDLIELVSQDEIVQKAQITEYIRSKDATGERAYPTVSVVD
jgi:hypothetical protein